SACGRRGVQAVDQTHREWLAQRGLERAGESVDRRLGDEDVALRCVALPGAAAGPVVAVLPGEGRGTPLPVDDAELALRAALVRLGHAADHLLGRAPLAE